MSVRFIYFLPLIKKVIKHIFVEHNLIGSSDALAINEHIFSRDVVTELPRKLTEGTPNFRALGQQPRQSVAIH